ncbi:MAG: GntR family transcriptional regulator [Gaiellaceae bacterium]
MSNASATATEAIRGAILDGRLAPGSRLKEEQLAAELGISRTPIREALLVLQTDGLVEAAPNRGATVRSYAPADLDELYQLRGLLEGHAARIAAERIAPPALCELSESCERFDAFRDADDPGALAAENQLFHETILAATGSDRLISMVKKVVEVPLVYRSFLWYSDEQRLISAHYHRQIAAALNARDAERAESIMKAHVHEARDFLVAAVAAHSSDTPLEGR